MSEARSSSSYVRISFLYPNYHRVLYVLREEIHGLTARVVREFESIGNNRYLEAQAVSHGPEMGRAQAGRGRISTTRERIKKLGWRKREKENKCSSRETNELYLTIMHNRGLPLRFCMTPPLLVRVQVVILRTDNELIVSFYLQLVIDSHSTPRYP